MASPVLAAQDTWFTKGASAVGVAKTDITEIRIVDSYTPTGEAKSWDGSNGNGGVTVYVEGTKLTIAGNGSGKVMANSDSLRVFRGFTAMASFDSGVLDTSNVTTFAYAFYDAASVEYLDLTSWNTSNVTSVQAAFNGMYALKTLLVYNWDTSKVTTMEKTFQCSCGLEVLDLSGWVTNSVTTMKSMFAGLASYGGPMKLSKVIGIENWDVRKVTTLYGLFNLNMGIESIDLSRWDNAACTDTSGMLLNMFALKKFTLGANVRLYNGSVASVHMPDEPLNKYGFDIPPVADDLDKNWYGIDGTPYHYTSIPSQVARTYYVAKSIVRNLDVVVKNSTMLDTADAIRGRTGIDYKIMPSRFGEAICAPVLSASFLASIKKSDLFEHLVFTSEVYTGSYSRTWAADELRIGSITGYKTGGTIIISSNGAPKIRVSSNASKLLAGWPLLRSIEGLDVLDVSGVKFFDGAFSDSSALTELDLSGLVFSSELNSYDGLFAGCYRLEKVTLWGGITYVSEGMFRSCIALEEIRGLSDVTEIGSQAFVFIDKLKLIDLDPSKITSIGIGACRRSNVEDVVNFANLPSDASIGLHALRSDRWDAAELASIQAFFQNNSGVYSDVYIEVPNSEHQDNFPTVPLTYKDGVLDETVSAGGCATVTTYHEWNAVYNKLGKENPAYLANVYPGFLSWWENLILANNENFVENSTDGNKLARVRSALGWQAAPNEWVSSVAQLKTIADHLSSGYPVYASVYSTNGSNMHAVLIIGMKPSEGKLAVHDCCVAGHEAVVSWLRFEDLFVKQAYSGNPDDYGNDALKIVSDHNIQEL